MGEAIKCISLLKACILNELMIITYIFTSLHRHYSNFNDEHQSLVLSDKLSAFLPEFRITSQFHRRNMVPGGRIVFAKDRLSGSPVFKTVRKSITFVCKSTIFVTLNTPGFSSVGKHLSLPTGPVFAGS